MTTIQTEAAEAKFKVTHLNNTMTTQHTEVLVQIGSLQTGFETRLTETNILLQQLVTLVAKDTAIPQQLPPIPTNSVPQHSNMQIDSLHASKESNFHKSNPTDDIFGVANTQ